MIDRMYKVVLIVCILILLQCKCDNIIDTDDYWYHLVPKLASDLPNLCPLTSLLNAREDGYLGYPYELFHTKEWNIDANGDNLYSCKGIDESLNGAPDLSKFRDGNYYKCVSSSTKGDCPLKIPNIQSALSAIKWKLRPQICQLHDKMISPNETVKVLVMGGSLPQGISTYGCCCKLDSKCPNENVLHVDCPRDRDDLNSGACSWPYYFERFLKSFPAHIEVINLSRGGQTSVLTLLQWEEYVSANIMTKNDVVFIDYSVNDQLSYGNRPNEVEFALEGIVRRFLAAGDNAPAIIILEMYPREPIKYVVPYRKVASHYKLPIISYYENVYSAFMNTSSPTFDPNEINPLSIDFLKFEHSYGDKAHPPFWVHIYYAELIATSMLVLSRHCLHMKTPKPLLHPAYESAMELHDSNTSTTIDVLHPSMQGQYFCLANSHVDFHIDSCQEMMLKINDSNHDVNTMMMIHSQCHHVNTSAITSTDAYSLRGFKLMIENKGKPGFIYETSSNPLMNTDNDVTVPINGGLMRGDGKLKISFLKTYENAGLFQVYACNTSLGTIDTLWTDVNELISITQTAVFLACDIHVKCANFAFPFIRISHNLGQDRIEKRLQQKVKLISISMCSRDQQCHHGITDSINIV